jgi:uncharacterized DUF497 family protein
MEFEFDTAKEALNRRKHGCSLLIGRIVLENRVGDVVDPRHSDEIRRIAYGMIDSRLFVCVYTMRGATCRLISVRKANARERKRWQS